MPPIGSCRGDFGEFDAEPPVWFPKLSDFFPFFVFDWIGCAAERLFEASRTRRFSRKDTVANTRLIVAFTVLPGARRGRLMNRSVRMFGRFTKRSLR